MAENKYDKYVVHPSPSQIRAEDDGRVVFDGLMVRPQQLGYNFQIGHQFVREPFFKE